MKINVKDSVVNKLANTIVYGDYQMKFYDDVVDGIKELKEKYRVAVISDTWPSLRRRLDKEGIMKLLDGLILSCDHDATKTTTKLFEIAISELKLVPEECIFIDDSVGNLKNAETVGMKPVLMCRNTAASKPEYPMVTCMNDIRDLITNMEGV